MTLEVSTSVALSFLLSGLVIVGWMAWGFREYRRTGRTQWLWLGVLMALSLLMAGLNYLRIMR